MSNLTDVEVLVKPECHLCAEALQVTEEACAEFGLEYRTTNITDDADLAAQFADHGRTGALERRYLALVWGVPAATAGTIDAAVLKTENNATLTPNPLALANGSTGKVNLAWKGLAAGSYVGRVTYAGSSAVTYVSVVVDGAGQAQPATAPELPTVSPADKLLTGPREATTPTGNK